MVGYLVLQVFLQDWTELDEDVFGELLMQLPFDLRVFILTDKPLCKAIEEPQSGLILFSMHHTARYLRPSQSYLYLPSTVDLKLSLQAAGVV